MTGDPLREELIASFVVPGEPMPLPRPRVTKNGTFTPKAAVQRKRKVAAHGQPHHPGTIEGPLGIRLTFVFPIRKSWSKKRVSEALSEGWHTQRPDADNLAKLVVDALQDDEWFKDDSQVAGVLAVKRWSTEGYTKVEVYRLGPNPEDL